MEGRPTTWERLRRVDPRVWDMASTVAVLTILLSDLWFERTAVATDRALEPLAAVTLIAAGVPLYWRRRRPMMTLAVVTSAAFVFPLTRHGAIEPILGLPLGIAAYSAAAHLARSRGLIVGLLGAFLTAAILQSDGGANWVEMAVNGLVTVGVPAAIGRMVWNRRRRLERERDLAARDAVASERARIARELHDVVAHSMSVMVVQAGGAQDGRAPRSGCGGAGAPVDRGVRPDRAGRDAPAARGPRPSDAAAASPRNQGSTGSTSCWNGCAATGLRGRARRRRRAATARRWAWTCPRTASCKRRSRTP